MKKILISVLALCAVLFSDQIDYPAAFDNTQDGDVIYFDVHVGGPFDTVANVVNGRLDNANIKTGANILPTKLDSSKTLFMRVVDADTVKNIRSVATADLTATGTSGLDTVTGSIATFTSHVTVDTLKVTKGINATIGNFSAGVNGTTGTFSSTVSVDSLKSTKGISSTNANLSAGLIATTGTFSSTVTVDTLKSTKGINATNFTGNHIGSINGGTTGTFSGTVTVDSLKSTKGINATNGSFSTKLGIGGTATQGEFEIIAGNPTGVLNSTNSTTANAFVFKNNDTNRQGFVGYGSTHATFPNMLSIKNYTTSGVVNIQTNSLTRLTVESDGDVGIGTTTPTTKLEVSTTFKSQSVTTDTIKSCKIITSDSANITKLAIANVSTGAGTFTGTVTADSIKSAKGVNATNGTFSSRVSVDTLFSTKGIKATNFTGNLIGNTSGYSNTNNNTNIGSGFEVFTYATGNENEVATGYQCLTGSTGAHNTAYGNYSMTYGSMNSDSNVAMGNYSLYSQYANGSNVAIGYKSMCLAGNSAKNVSVGERSLYNGTSASNSVAIGHNSMYNNNTGADNVGIGYQGLYSNTGGNRNTSVGSQACASTTGSYNVALGYQALSSNKTGSYNVAIGSGSASNVDTILINTTSIGANSSALKDSTFNVNITQIRNYADSATAYADGIRSGCIYRVGSQLRIMW
jgi:hypothetical protein